MLCIESTTEQHRVLSAALTHGQRIQREVHNYLKQFNYSLIAFDERVTFWLQRVPSLPCACAYYALFARRLAYNHYAIAHAYNAANAHTQGSDRAR